MKKINLFNKKENKIVKSVYASDFKRAKEMFNNEFSGAFEMVEDASGVSKKCFLK